MGISGYEVLIVSSLSPFFLAIPSIRRLVVKHLRISHLLSLVGLLAYQVEDPTNRLLVVGLGVVMACLSWTATWYSEAGQPGRLEAKISAWTIGLIASSVVKFAFKTTNPIWPTSHAANGGWNGVGFILAVLAILRSTRKAPVAGSESAQVRKEGSSVLPGIGVGGLFFGLHALLSDSSTMILWTWEGYPVR